jgi:hypothetical protein
MPLLLDNNSMRGRIIFILSVGLNIGLLACFLYQERGSNTPDKSQIRSPVRYRIRPNPSGPAIPKVLIRRQYFSWSEIESDDFATFIDNLRNIDCPEQTIIDIVIAEVDYIYNQRRIREINTPMQQWWQSAKSKEFAQSWSEQEQKLEKERQALLARLLGPGWQIGRESRMDRGYLDLNGAVLGELTEAAKTKVQAIHNASDQRIQEYLEQKKRAGEDPNTAELASLRQQARSELAQILTPAQMEEYLLRYSATANKLRNLLNGFEATPDEFRQLFRIYDSSESQMQGADNALVAKAKTSELERQRDISIRQILSGERYKLFQLVQEPDYTMARSITEKFGAPSEKVMPLYEVNRLISSTQGRIKQDKTLTQVEREEALKMLEEQKNQSIKQILAGKTALEVQAGSEDNPPLPDMTPTE